MGLGLGAPYNYPSIYLPTFLAPPTPQNGQGQTPAQDPAKLRQTAIEKKRSENYSKIMAHEQAHASAAGSLGGGIHLEYDGNGIPIGGSVQIAMPALDSANPERTYALANQVRAAAQAPGGEMSAADSKVAQSASEIMGRAQVLMGKKLPGQNVNNSKQPS